MRDPEAKVEMMVRKSKTTLVMAEVFSCKVLGVRLWFRARLDVEQSNAGATKVNRIYFLEGRIVE